MPLEIPLTFDSERINDFLKKLFPTIKYIGYAFWMGFIIYFFCKYLKSGNNYSFIFSMVLLGMLLREFYNKWEKSRRKK